MVSEQLDIQNTGDEQPKPLEVIPIESPPREQRVRRNADFAAPGEKKSRYALPTFLDSSTTVGYRMRISMSRDEARTVLPLLALKRPTAFAAPEPITEAELFEESALGIMSARQSTNFPGHRQVTLGPDDSIQMVTLLRQLEHRNARVLDDACYTHVMLTRPYRTLFTLLLTFIGHFPIVSLLTVPWRGLRKRLKQIDDIPTIGFLQHLHVGVLADAVERACVIASGGRRRAQVHLSPFASYEARRGNRGVLRKIAALCGSTCGDRFSGWRVAFVAQVGTGIDRERFDISEPTLRKLGANLIAMRSERIQPGVNQDEHAPPQYCSRQDMDVPEALTIQAGRAAYNAFAHWAGCDRKRSKKLLLLDRIDVLTPNGKERLRAVRKDLNDVTDSVIKDLPLWADLPTGRSFSRAVDTGRKAFGLAGQRIYIGGLSRPEIEASGIQWELAVCATGAAAARSALHIELMGCVDLPDDCDMLAGICLMAGPVNQNDIGKQFYGRKDLLAETYPDRDPTSMLVWTLKAKTIADPIGNEEQLLNKARQGKLVDLRLGPHDVIRVRRNNRLEPMRKRGGRVNAERAFGDLDNFVVAPNGREIPGNRGSLWPEAWRNEIVWTVEGVL
ncbi:MAG: hypothetical protein V3T05_02040 [Myxococcota bacterium]